MPVVRKEKRDRATPQSRKLAPVMKPRATAATTGVTARGPAIAGPEKGKGRAVKTLAIRKTLRFMLPESIRPMRTFWPIMWADAPQAATEKSRKSMAPPTRTAANPFTPTKRAPTMQRKAAASFLMPGRSRK
jgi:hypothetical protein